MTRLKERNEDRHRVFGLEMTDGYTGEYPNWIGKLDTHISGYPSLIMLKI
jgi:hypothetical protein